jgi:hypothetical protein
MTYHLFLWHGEHSVIVSVWHGSPNVWAFEVPFVHSCNCITGGDARSGSHHQNGVPPPETGNWRRSHAELGQQQQGL